VGLVPANQGYAIHNTSTGHLVDYFAYDNEQVFQPDVVNTTVWSTIQRANPYIDPLTNQPDPNALCFSNPAVYFAPRSPLQNDTTLTVHSSPLPKTMVRVYPNPASELVEVEIFAEEDTYFTYTLSNAIGNRVIEGKGDASVFRISLQGLLPGSYSLNINSNAGVPLYRTLIFKQ
jgi:hypothetical protein